MSANFSDSDEDGERVAEGRRATWDGVDEAYDRGAGAEYRDEGASFSFSDAEPEPETEPETEPAGALFGRSSDPIGDLRTKAKDMNRKAMDSVDAYVRAAAKEARNLRSAVTKISALQREGQKKLASVKKDKKLSEDAKRAQQEQFTSLTAEIAIITRGLKEQEVWMNQLLGQRVVPSSGKQQQQLANGETRSRGWKAEEKVLPPQSRTAPQKVKRSTALHMGAGMKYSYKLRDETKSGVSDGYRHLGLDPGAEFTLTNSGNAAARYKLIYPPM
jgi:hypothetical protein